MLQLVDLGVLVNKKADLANLNSAHACAKHIAKKQFLFMSEIDDSNTSKVLLCKSILVADYFRKGVMHIGVMSLFLNRKDAVPIMLENCA